MKDELKKQKTLATISALNTILERYPKLLNWDSENGVETSFTAISFLMDILKMFGITEESILEWLTTLISGTQEGGVEKGILFAINEAIKALLIAYLNGMYDCPIDPVLPDEFLKSPYRMTDSHTTFNEGFKIPLEEIDAFGLLQNIPMSSGGSIFYFDVDPDYHNSSTIYSSTDMNAFLWFVINRGSRYNDRADHRCVWDNRNAYRFIFDGNGGAGKEAQKKFADEECQNSPYRFVSNIGPKKEILICEFVESAYSVDPGEHGTTGIKEFFNSNYLNVHGVWDRYHETGLNGLNKTIYQFNVDYVSSLKLFDSKTLVAQVINAIIGFAGSFSINASIEKSTLYSKIHDVVEQIMNEPEESDAKFEEYFTFSDEKYSRFVEDATLRYNSQYSTGNDQGDAEDINSDEIVNAILNIRPSVGQEETEQAVMSALVSASDILARSGYIDSDDKYAFKLSIITKFINELIVQLSMQILTPKVMLIFAINNRFLNGNEVGTIQSIEKFFKDFWNIIKACTKKITKMIMDALIDMVIGQIKPIIDLAIRKLLLESIMYYRILLQQVLAACAINPSITLNPLFKYGQIMIDNVDYADIIPTETTPRR